MVEIPPVTMADALESFEEELRESLSDRTYRGYCSALQLFRLHADSYGPNHISGEKLELWDRESSKPDGLTFAEIVGPEYIPALFSEFLSYFMPRKVQPSKSLANATEKMVKKLGKWLVEKGYADESQEPQVERGSLEQATKLREALEEVCAGGDEARYPKYHEGHFTIDEVTESGLVLYSFEGDKIAVSLPAQVRNHARQGMDISGIVGKGRRGWEFMEVWNVYP